MKRSVRNLIDQRKLQDIISVSPQTSVFETLIELEKSSCSAILVVADGRLRGIVSEKDFARASVHRGPLLFDKVETLMTTKVHYVEPSFSLEECLQIMSQVHVRHLPVMENGKPIALLSMRHIMELLVDDKETQIRELTNYITGGSLGAEQSQKPKKSKLPIYFTLNTQEVL